MNNVQDITSEASSNNQPSNKAVLLTPDMPGVAVQMDKIAQYERRKPLFPDGIAAANYSGFTWEDLENQTFIDPLCERMGGNAYFKKICQRENDLSKRDNCPNHNNCTNQNRSSEFRKYWTEFQNYLIKDPNLLISMINTFTKAKNGENVNPPLLDEMSHAGSNEVRGKTF